jgi:hypothetical protein
VVNDVHNFAYLLANLLLAACTGGFGLAMLAGRVVPRWLGWSGVGTGVALFAAVTTGQGDLLDNAGLLWLVWVATLGIVLVGHRPVEVDERAAVAGPVGVAG